MLSIPMSPETKAPSAFTQFFHNSRMRFSFDVGQEFAFFRKKIKISYDLDSRSTIETIENFETAHFFM